MGLLGKHAVAVTPARDGEPEGLGNVGESVSQNQIALEIVAGADCICGDPLRERSAHMRVGDQTLVEQALSDHQIIPNGHALLLDCMVGLGFYGMILCGGLSRARWCVLWRTPRGIMAYDPSRSAWGSLIRGIMNGIIQHRRSERDRLGNRQHCSEIAAVRSPLAAEVAQLLRRIQIPMRPAPGHGQLAAQPA